MPELPEVETIVRELKKTILGRKIEDVWTDFKKMVKKPADFGDFGKEIKGRKILNVRRRAKNIIFDLTENKSLLIHQKLTGHLLFGKWRQKEGKWESEISGPLSEDPANKFLHLIFFLDNNRQLALSDLRKFAKAELWDKNELENSMEFKELGPEPLEKSFTFQKFKKALEKKKGEIKQILMDQKIIAGIGNIYSDEILWTARVHPFREVSKLAEKELKDIYLAMKKILLSAVKLGGESISDFRRLSGKKGGFDKERRVYRREGEKCRRCQTTIKRAKIGGRSSHFCPKCQKFKD